MATAPLNYIPGGDPAAEEANRKYQEALDKMLQSLDARKNRLFDPTLLAFAGAMLDPGRTGSFGEALGRAAGAVGASEAQRAKEDQELAKMRLELAQAGIGLEAQRARDRAYQQELGGPQTTLGMTPPAAVGAPTPAAGMPTPGVIPGGMPGAAPAQPQPIAPGESARTFPVPSAGTAPAAATAAPQAPPGFEGVAGIPTLPPDPKFLGRQDYLRAAQREGRPFAQALKEASDIEAKRYDVKEGGVLDRRTGMFFQFPKGELVERQIGGSSYTVPSQIAAQLDLYQSTNNPKYAELAKQVTEGGVAGPLKSVTERAAEREGAVTEAKGMAETAVKKASEAEGKRATAGTMLFNANRVQQLVQRSPDAFGIFARPGIVAAIGNVVNQGLRAGATSVQLGGFEDSIRALMPGVKQQDLNNVAQAAGAMAEIELAYTVLYMQKQGAITEGEREIVRRIGGTTSQNAQVLAEKGKLIQLRAQHDINVYDAWRKFQEENPRKNYNDFERSPTYQNMLKQYDSTVSRSFGIAPPQQSVSPGDFTVRKITPSR